MEALVKNYGPIGVAIVTFVISIIVTWTTFEVRMTNVEARQDRQASTIMAMQVQLTDQATEYAALKATIDAINANVTYIRDRIDKITP